MIKDNKSVKLPIKRILSSLSALIILLILVFIPTLTVEIKVLLFVLAIIIGSYYFSIEAIEAIFIKHKITIDVLMLLAYLAAGFLGQFVDATFLIFLYSITETLESVTYQRTRSMIYSILSTMPPTCLKITEAGEKETNIDDLLPNDLILVKAGDLIPVDGLIMKGNAYIDESSLTGEYLPVHKSVNNAVFAGTLVTDSILTIRVLKPVSESSVAKLIKSVEEAQKHKHPLDLLVNRFTKIYNPIIIVISLLILTYGIAIGNLQTFGIMSASFLVAGAPCALAIGTPVTVISAVGSAGKNGILVKGGSSLERLANVTAFAFDKTGTLTFGQPDLADVITFERDIPEILSIAAGLEMSSNHPYAKAIIEKNEEQKTKLLQMEDIKNIPGYGVEGYTNNKRYYIGSLYKDFQVRSEEKLRQIETYKEQGYSLSFVFEETKILGVLLFNDTIRKQTSETIDYLQQHQYQTFILTGDNQKNAFNIGNSLNIPTKCIFADLKPDDKLKKILELKNLDTLAMIGDGINDGPALAAADLGIAMGTIGTDLAIETADILIMSDSLNVLQKGLSIASKMKSVLKQNIIISTMIILAVTSAVLLNFITLPLVILAHEGSEVLIVGNSLRLLSRY